MFKLQVKMGKKLTEKHKEKLRKIALAGGDNYFKKGQISRNRGKPMSEEQRIKLRNAKLGKTGKNANNWKGGKICPNCGSEKKKYTSSLCRECFLNNIPIGEDSPNWRGGKTGKIKLIRNSKEYIEWREAVFIRDDFTCQKCESKGCYLNAHHIKQAAFYPELMLDVDNGITLCEGCHKEVPITYNLKKINVESA